MKGRTHLIRCGLIGNLLLHVRLQLSFLQSQALVSCTQRWAIAAPGRSDVLLVLGFDSHDAVVKVALEALSLGSARSLVRNCC